MSVTTVEEAIVSTLLADTGVKAITTYIRPQNLGQNPTYPAIVYSNISDIKDQTLRGPSGLSHARLRFDVIAESYSAAKALSKAIRAALDGKTFTVDTVRLRSALSMGETDLYEDEIECHRISSDFTVWYTE